MYIYDENGDIVTEYDESKGWLREMSRMRHHDAVEAVEEQGHWETLAEYPETGGKDVEWVVDVPGVEAKDAWDEEEIYLLYTPYTEEELTYMEEQKNKPTAEELLEALMEGIANA